MRKLSLDKVQSAKVLLQQGKSTSQVARALGISISSAIRIRRHEIESIPPPKMGRPSLVSPSTKRTIAREVDTGKLRTISDVQQYIQSTEGVLVNKETARNYVKSEGLKNYVRPFKRRLTKDHIKQRMAFAEEHLHWTVNDWKRVMFSDEVIFERLKTFRSRTYYRRPEHRSLGDREVRETSKGRYSKLLWWGCITYYGVGDACKFPITVDSPLYVDALQDYILASWKWYKQDPAELIFQQDNASVHTSKLTREFFAKSHINVLIWPANSPDLNPIENVWAYMAHRLKDYEEAPEDLDEFWERLQTIWTSIPVDFIHGLYESMPERMQELHRRRGGRTRY